MPGPVIVIPPGSSLGGGSPEFALPGSQTSGPAGLEAVLEYNGIQLGNSGVVDKYRIMSIEGLGDPDIRDNRENNPSSHGETAFTAYYGGRSITITGRIEAHNLGKLRDMQQALKEAFSSLEEAPLYFRMSESTRDHYIGCRKVQALTMGEEQKDGVNFYRDFIISLRASDPRFYAVSERTYVIYPNQVPNYGFETDVSGWTKEASSWSSSEFAQSGTWSSEGSKSGLFKGVKDATATFREANIHTANGTSGMPVIPGRKYLAKVTLNVVKPSTKGNRIRILWWNSAGTNIANSTSGAFLESGVVSHTFEAEVPAGAAYATVGLRVDSEVASESVEIYIDNVWFTQSNGESEPGQVKVTNLGSWQSEPRIRVHGSVSRTKIVNTSNGEVFSLNAGTTIGATYWEANIRKRTLKDASGVNKFSELNTESDWMTIEAGENIVTLDPGMLGTSTEAAVEIYSKDAWL